MKKTVKAVIGILIVLVVAFLYAHIDKNVYLYDRNADTDSFIGTGIIVDNELSQTFICQEEVLDGINMKSSVFGDVSEVSIEYSLSDYSAGEVVASGVVQGTDIKNNKFHNYPINHITGAKGKKYVFTVSEVGADTQKGIGFYSAPQQETDTELVINGSRVEGTLIARTISHRFDLETFFVFLLFVVYIVVFMKFLYRLFK